MYKKKILLISIVIISVILLSNSYPTNATTYVSNKKINISPSQIAFWTIPVSADNDIATVSFTCINCQITFYIATQANSTLAFNNESYRIANFISMHSVTNKKIQLGSNNTFVFVFRNDDLFLTKTIQVTIAINPPPIKGLSQISDLFPYIFLIFIAGVVAFFAFNRFKLRRSGIKEPIFERTNFKPDEPIIVTSNRKIPIEVLQKFWTCPNDTARLQLVSDRIAGTPVFTITNNKTQIGIMNAIAVRKIPPESQEQTERLVKELFEQYDIDDIMLVNTRCPICNKFYTAPQL